MLSTNIMQAMVAFAHKHISPPLVMLRSETAITEPWLMAMYDGVSVTMLYKHLSLNGYKNLESRTGKIPSVVLVSKHKQDFLFWVVFGSDVESTKMVLDLPFVSEYLAGKN